MPLTFTVDSHPSACVLISGETSTPSFHRPIRKTTRIFLGVYVVANASLIVWKFLRDLDILEPDTDRWPMCRK